MNGYIFDHIPKTGGTSLRGVFLQLFGEDKVTPNVTGTVADALVQYGQYSMVMGHFWHTPRGLPSDRESLTFLRCPEDRLLSHYWFGRTQTNTGEERAVFYAQSLRFEEFIASAEPDVLIVTRNYQTRHFVRLMSSQPVTDLGDQRALGLAKEAIDAYAFVGLYEAFQDSVDLMCCRFGWPFVQEIPHHNRTARREQLEDLDPGLRKRLRQLNALDVELYEYAKTRFMAEKRKVMSQVIATGDRFKDTTAVTGSSPARPKPDQVQSLEFGDKSAEIVSVKVMGSESGKPTITSGEEATVRICIRAQKDIEDLTVGLEIRDSAKRCVFGTNSRVLGRTLAIRAGHEMELHYGMRMDLGRGEYAITVALHPGFSHLERCYHWKEDAVRFTIVQYKGPQFSGIVRLLPSLKVQSSRSA